MRKLLFIMLFVLCAVASPVPAQSVRTLFLNAPDEMFPLLTKNCRADLVDYIDAGMKAKVVNELDGESVLETLADDYLLLRPTARSSVQMKLLPAGEGNVICLVRTVEAEAADSRIEFYDTQWNRLDGSDMFAFPAIEEFFVSHDAAAECIDMCDIYLVSLALNAGDNTMVAEYTMPAYMIIENAGKVKPLLRKPVYRWNGHRFVSE